MKMQISGKHIEIGDSLKTHIETALKTIVGRHLGDVLEAHVTISKSTLFQFETDIAVHVSRHFVVRSHAGDNDPYRSCDLALEKMESRIHRYKARLRDRHRHNGHAENVAQMISAQQYIINSSAEDTGEDTPIIIAEMTSEIPTLSVGEAVMRMDLSDSGAMMFRNTTNGQFNMVYRRPDGNVGWVDPALVNAG